MKTKSKYTMTTQKEVRNSFWSSFPEFKSEYKSNKRQNEYKCDIRMTFIDYIDSLVRNNEISEDLAKRVTL